MNDPDPQKFLQGSVSVASEAWQRLYAKEHLEPAELDFRVGLLNKILSDEEFSLTLEEQAAARQMANTNRIDLEEYRLIEDDPRINTRLKAVEKERSKANIANLALTETLVLYEGFMILLQNAPSEA